MFYPSSTKRRSPDSHLNEQIQIQFEGATSPDGNWPHSTSHEQQIALLIIPTQSEPIDGRAEALPEIVGLEKVLHVQ